MANSVGEFSAEEYERTELFYEVHIDDGNGFKYGYTTDDPDLVVNELVEFLSFDGGSFSIVQSEMTRTEFEDLPEFEGP